MKKLRFALFGCGYWSNYQIPGWRELDGAELVAVYNRTRAKAEAVASKFKVPAVYDDPEKLLSTEELDFVDIVTDVDTHARFTEMAAARGLPVVCQKPMASDYETAREMVESCSKRGVKLFINENFRWQAPIRRLKSILDSGAIGRVFKARLTFCSRFPVFDNQPFLAELDRFILADVGSHIFDVARFLFGEVESLYCLTQRVNPRIKAEDVANALLETTSGIHCYAEMSYASLYEREAFPQTLALVEGELGSVRLTHDYVLKVTTGEGTRSETAEPVRYPWIDPDYAVVHSSIVDAQRNILQGLRGGAGETTGADNLETVKLVWAAYASAASGNPVQMRDF